MPDRQPQAGAVEARELVEATRGLLHALRWGDADQLRVARMEAFEAVRAADHPEGAVSAESESLRGQIGLLRDQHERDLIQVREAHEARRIAAREVVEAQRSLVEAMKERNAARAERDTARHEVVELERQRDAAEVDRHIAEDALDDLRGEVVRLQALVTQSPDPARQSGDQTASSSSERGQTA